jgi:hypothetical protein
MSQINRQSAGGVDLGLGSEAGDSIVFGNEESARDLLDLESHHDSAGRRRGQQPATTYPGCGIAAVLQVDESRRRNQTVGPINPRTLPRGVGVVDGLGVGFGDAVCG